MGNLLIQSTRLWTVTYHEAPCLECLLCWKPGWFIVLFQVSIWLPLQYTIFTRSRSDQNWNDCCPIWAGAAQSSFACFDSSKMFTWPCEWIIFHPQTLSAQTKYEPLAALLLFLWQFFLSLTFTTGTCPAIYTTMVNLDLFQSRVNCYLSCISPQTSLFILHQTITLYFECEWVFVFCEH